MDDPSTPDVDESKPVDDPSTPDVDESQTDNPTQDPNSSSVADTAVLPEAPYSKEEVEDLAVSLQRNGPFFLGNDVRSKESSMKIAKEILDAVVAMGWDKPSIQAETKEAIQSVYQTADDPANTETRKWENPDVPTTDSLTQHTPQSGPTPSGVSDVPGALSDNPAPTDAGGESPNVSSSTDPSNPPTSGETPSDSVSTSSASEAESSHNP